MTILASNVMRRAALCVALFVFAPCPAMNAWFKFVPVAYAKMRQDKLTVVPAGGGPARAFTIEVATTEREKAVGLMFRTELADSEGMLFPYSAERPLQMWM